jgi:hypothetical protein
VDDQIAVRFLDRHDLEFPTAFIVSDPSEHGCARIWTVLTVASVVEIT